MNLMTKDATGRNRMIGTTILIVDDDELYRFSFKKVCERIEMPDLEILVAATLDECIAFVEDRKIDVILLDKIFKDQSGTNMSSIPLIPKILNQQPHVQILVITSDKDPQSLANAIKLGAFGFLTKDESSELLFSQIEKAIQVSKLTPLHVDSEAKRKHSIMLGARSPAMQKAVELAKAFSRGKRPVLILGETGTGKTTLARYIHEQYCHKSGYADLPLVSVNLSAIPQTLLERELFGNEKGAFTDAKERRRGYFELANGGILFLDEIGEITLETQVKLLKVIEEKEFYRLGSDQAIRSNFKLICSTHRNLNQLVQEGRFREDLFMRISTLQIHLPSLSDRREDIVPIIEAALPVWAVESEVNVQFSDLPSDLIVFLENEPIRGNIRGIEQQLSRIFALAPRLIGGRLDFTFWRDALISEPSRSLPHSQGNSVESLLNRELDIKPENFPGINYIMDKIESAIYRSLSKKCRNNTELAAILKTSQATVSGKMKRFGLNEK